MKSYSNQRASQVSSGRGNASNEPTLFDHADCTNLPIPAELTAQWQETVDLLARVTGAPLVLLSVADSANGIRPLIRNTGCQAAFCTTGDSDSQSDGFCFRVVTEQRELHLPDVSADTAYQHNQLVKQGLISYFGVPICWPTGQAFGAICILADHPDAFPLQMRRVVQQFRRMIEEDLETLAKEAGVPHLDQPLRDRDRLFRSITELSPDAIIVADGEQIILVNAAAAKLLRAESVRDLIGKPVTDIIPSLQLEAFHYHLQRLLSGEESTVDFDERTVRAVDGSIIPIDAAGSRVTYKGRPAVQIVARDVSWRKETEKLLRQYRRIVSATPDLISLLDRHYTFQLVNEACQEAWALPSEEIVGRSITDFVDTKLFHDIIEPRLKRCFNGETIRFQQWFEYSGRGRCFMSVTLTPLLDDDGAIIGVVSAARDITDIKEIEDRLRHSEDKFRTVADSAIDWDYWLDPDGNLEYMSPSCKIVSGYAVEDFLRKPDLLDTIVDPADQTLHSGMDCATLGQREAVTSEFRIRAADGQLRWIHHTCRPIHADDGRFLGRRATNHDVTQRKDAEQALAESEQRYRDLAEQAPVAIVESNRDGRIQYLNRNACETFLLTPRDIEDGLTIFDLLVEYDRDRARERFSMHALGQPGPPAEYVGLRSDGSTIALLVHSRPIYHEDAFVGLRSIAIDITERKRAEQDIQRSQATLAHAQKMAHLGSWTHDLVTNTVRWSEEMYRIFGRDPATFRPTTEVFWEQMHPEDRPMVEDTIEKIIGSHRPQDVEFRVIRTNNSERIVHCRTDVRLGEDDLPVELIGSLLDVTEHKRHERIIRESAAKMRAILDSVDSGLILIDQHGYVQAFNETARKRARQIFDRELVEGAPMLQFVRQMDRESFMANLNRTINGDPVSFDRRSHDSEGRPRWHTVRYRPVEDDQHNVIAVLFSVTDITERKEAELSIKRSEDTLRQVVDLVPHDIYAVDDTGRFIIANKTFASNLGLTSDLVVGHHVFDLFPSSDEQGRGPDAQDADIIQSGRPKFIPEKLQVYPDGRERWVQTSKVPFDHFGRPAVLTVAVDITERKQAEFALLQQQEITAAMIEAIPDMIFRYSREGITLAFSAGSGASPVARSSDIVDTPLDDLLPPDIVSQIRIAINATLKSGQPQAIEFTLEADGQDRIYEGRMVVCGTDQVMLIARDITERKTAELARRESEAKIQSILTAAPVGIGMTVNRDIVWASDRLLSMLGYSENELLGQSALVLYPTPEEYHRVGTEKYADIDRYGWGEVTTQWVRKDGEVCDILLRSAPTDPSDLSRGVIFTAMDITERKRSEDALRYSELRYRELVERMQSGVVVFEVVDDGADFIYKEINRAASSISKLSRDDVIGRRLLDVRPEMITFSLFDALREVWQTGVPKALPLTYYDSHDTACWIEGHIYRIDTANVVFIFDDVTERIEAFEELSKVDKLESIGVLAGGIAHDFNNVLTGIVGNVSLLKSMMDDEYEGHALLDEAEKAAMRARSLTQQLLTFSQGGAPVLTTTSIASVIRECTEFVLHGSNVACEFNLADNLALVEADEGQISQVIANMVINASQAMTRGGKVWVTAENVVLSEREIPSLSAGRYVCLSITDSGEGILPENIPRIFDPFFTTKDIGRGLGLATCYAIVRKHDGHIEVESTPGEGTCFRVYLPASDNDRSDGSTSLYNLRAAVGKVLVVDDEQVVRRVAASTLRHIGYDVTTAASGEAALEMYAQALNKGETFDAVLLDLTMPGGLSGEQTLHRLREIDPDVQAIVSSGYSNDPIVANYTDYGFAACIVKPYTFSKLGDTLAQVIGTQHA